MPFAAPHRSSSRHYPRIADVDRFLQLAAEPSRLAVPNFYRDLLTRPPDALVRAAQPRPAFMMFKLNSLGTRALAVIDDARKDGRLSEGEVIILHDLLLHPDLPAWMKEDRWRPLIAPDVVAGDS